MRQSQQKSTAPGWFPVEPVAATTSAAAAGGSRGRAVDPLGLSRPSNLLRFLTPKPSSTRHPPSLRPPGNQSRPLSSLPVDEDAGSRRTPTQRHRKLVVRDSSGENAGGNVAEAFSPLRSLRLASIPARLSSTQPQDEVAQHRLLPMVKQYDRQATAPVENAVVGTASQQRGRLRRLDQGVPSPLPLPPPLHELIQTVAEGVFEQDDPLLQLNRASVVQLFMEQWQRQFDADAANFKSIGTRAHASFAACRRC